MLNPTLKKEDQSAKKIYSNKMLQNHNNANRNISKIMKIKKYIMII